MATLQQFKEFLRRIDPNDDGQFQEAVKTGTALLGITDGDLADHFDMSRPSVNRWKNGRNAPHPAFRKSVYSFFTKRVAKVLAAQALAEDEDDGVDLDPSSPSMRAQLMATPSER